MKLNKENLTKNNYNVLKQCNVLIGFNLIIQNERNSSQLFCHFTAVLQMLKCDELWSLCLRNNQPIAIENLSKKSLL